MLGACALLVVAGLGRSLLGLTAFTSTDILYGLPPWSAHGDGSAPANAFVGDPVDAVYPPMREIADRLWAGDLPAWTSRQAGGTELASTPSLAVLSPLSWPYLVLPLWLAPAWVKLLEIAVAISGCFLFGRRLGLDRAAALLGGLAFATSGFLVAWTNWPQARTAALIPLLFWAVERLVQERTGRSVALLAAAVAGLVLSGFPAVTAYALYSAGAYSVVRMVAVEVRAARGRAGIRAALGGLALAAGGVTAGVALTAVQALPFVHQLGQIDLSYRGQTSENALSALPLLTAMAPDALGTPVASGTWLGPRNPIESFSYVGVAVLLLAAIGALGLRASRWSADDPHPSAVDRSTGVRTFLVVAVAVWGVAAYAGGPVLAAIQQLPAMDTNAIGRARSVLGFFVAMLAAVGFHLVAGAAGRRPPQPSSRRRWPWGGWLLLGGALAWLVADGSRYATEERFTAAYAQSLAVAVGLAALAAVAVLLAVRGAARVRALGLVLLVSLVVGQAAVAVQPWWPESPPESFYPATATHEFLAAELGHDRYVAADDAMLPGTSLAYGLRSLDGHAFLRPGFRDLLSSVDRTGFVAPTLWHPHLTALADPTAGPLLDRLGVRFVVAPPDADVVGVPRTVGAGTEALRWQPGRVLRVDLAGAAVRGVGVQPAATPATAGVMRAQVFDAAGTVLADATRDISAVADDALVVPLPGIDASSDASSGGASGGGVPAYAELTLQAEAALEVLGIASSGPQLVVVDATDDGMRLVRAGEATVYERLTALPRIRWAGTAEVAPPREAVARLGAADAADVVLAPSDGAGAAIQSAGAARSTAEIEVLEDSGDAVRVSVTAAGAGHLVLADAAGDTFEATVDGVATALRTADHGYVAVAIPAGTHLVEIVHRAPGGRLGLVVSAVALLLLVGLAATDPGGPGRIGRSSGGRRLSAPGRTPARRGRAAPAAGR